MERRQAARKRAPLSRVSAEVARMALSERDPGRDSLARAVRRVAAARGRSGTRHALLRVAAAAVAWAAMLEPERRERDANGNG